MAEKLRVQGAEVLELPAITTSAIEENEGLRQPSKTAGIPVDRLYKSDRCARVLLKRWERCSVDIRKMAGVKIAAIGEGTKKN